MEDESPAGSDGQRRGWPVETSLGVMYMRHVGWGVLVDNSSNSIPITPDGPLLTYAGKQFTATVGVYPNGEVERAYVNKVDGHITSEAAPSYRAKVIEVAVESALAWIAANPLRVVQGEHYRAEMDVYSAQAQVDRLQPEYEHAVETLRVAKQRLLDKEALLDAITNPPTIIVPRTPLRGRAHVIDSEGRPRDAYSGELLDL